MKILALLILTTIPFLKAQTRTTESKESQKYTYLGNEKLTKKKTPEAEVDYRMAISKDAKNIVPKYNLGNMYYESENYDEAILRYQQAAKKALTKQDKHKAYHNLGNSLMKKEDYNLAMEAYKHALINNPTDEETRYNYALAKELQKKENKNKNKDENKDKNQDKNQQNKDGTNNKKDEQNKNKDNKKGENKDDSTEKNNGENQPKNSKPNEKKENAPNQPKRQQTPSQLSPEHVENLLEAVSDEERKVQNKINGQKMNIGSTKQEKDW